MQFTHAFYTLDVSQAFAIRRRGWAYSAPRAACNKAGFSVGQVERLDIEHLFVGVLVIDEHVTGSRILCVIEVVAVWGKCRFTQFLLVVSARLLDNRNALGVCQP